jgi:hypothetical protein
MEYMNVGAEIQNDYQRELETAGWSTILDPTRLHNDKTFVQSRRILGNAKKAMQRCAARGSAMQTMRSKIISLNIDSNLKEKMLQSYDRSVKTWQPKRDRIVVLEEGIVGEVENMINFLEAKSDSWTVIKGEMVFQSDQDADKYNAFLGNIQRYATEQERIKKEAVDATKAALGQMKEGL